MNPRELASPCWKWSGVGTEGEHKLCRDEMRKLLDLGCRSGASLKLQTLKGTLKLGESKA